MDWQSMETLIEEIAVAQKAKVLASGRRIVPTLTSDDMLQPNDFPELEVHPEFRYEEGVLSGVLTVQMALRAQQRE